MKTTRSRKGALCDAHFDIGSFDRKPARWWRALMSDDILLRRPLSNLHLCPPPKRFSDEIHARVTQEGGFQKPAYNVLCYKYKYIYCKILCVCIHVPGTKSSFLLELSSLWRFGQRSGAACTVHANLAKGLAVSVRTSSVPPEGGGDAVPQNAMSARVRNAIDSDLQWLRGVRTLDLTGCLPSTARGCGISGACPRSTSTAAPRSLTRGCGISGA